MFNRDEIIRSVDLGDSIGVINDLYIIEEHDWDGEVEYTVAWAETGEPTNGNQYEVFETLEEAIEYMENFKY